VLRVGVEEMREDEGARVGLNNAETDCYMRDGPLANDVLRVRTHASQSRERGHPKFVACRTRLDAREPSWRRVRRRLETCRGGLYGAKRSPMALGKAGFRIVCFHLPWRTACLGGIRA